MKVYRIKDHIVKGNSLKDALNKLVKDSPASEIVKEIKAKYPQVRIKQVAKQTKDGDHITRFVFSNYPGEEASGFSNDPRTTLRNN